MYGRIIDKDLLKEGMKVNRLYCDVIFSVCRNIIDKNMILKRENSKVRIWYVWREGVRERLKLKRSRWKWYENNVMRMFWVWDLKKEGKGKKKKKDEIKN